MFVDRVEEVLGSGFQLVGSLMEEAGLLKDPFIRAFAGDRLDSTDAAGRAGFVDDLEKADLAGRRTSGCRRKARG